MTDPEGTRVVEQNYQFDLVSQQKLVERYVGQTISGKVILEKGVAAGETVVTDGQSRLFPGAKISTK